MNQAEADVQRILNIPIAPITTDQPAQTGPENPVFFYLQWPAPQHSQEIADSGTAIIDFKLLQKNFGAIKGGEFTITNKGFDEVQVVAEWLTPDGELLTSRAMKVYATNQPTTLSIKTMRNFTQGCNTDCQLYQLKLMGTQASEIRLQVDSNLDCGYKVFLPKVGAPSDAQVNSARKPIKPIKGFLG